jgi:hypothetical protein
VAVNNSVTRFDNVKIQKLPPATTFEFDPSALLSPREGQWTAADGDGFLGTPAGSEVAALSTLLLEVEVSSWVEFETTVRTAAGGGVVFDHYGPQDFKYAAIRPDTGQVVIGHRTPRGWTEDVVVDHTMDPAMDHTLRVSMTGSTVELLVNGQSVASHAYHGLLNDGELGLISLFGESRFGDVVVRGDDAGYDADAAVAVESATVESAMVSEPADPEQESSENPLAGVDGWVIDMGTTRTVDRALASRWGAGADGSLYEEEERR